MLSDLVICAVAYAAGVLVSSKISLSYVLLFGGCMLLAYIIRCIISKKTNIFIFISILLFCAGTVRYYQANTNRLYYEFPEKYVNITGTVSAIPQKTEKGCKFTLSVDTVSYKDVKYKIKKTVMIYSDSAYEYGDSLTVSGFLQKFPQKLNESDFDVALHYKSKGLYNFVTAHEIEKTGTSHSLSPIFLAGKAKFGIYKLIDKHYTEDAGALMKAIILGCRTDFSDEYNSLLLKTGMLHFLYAPFMHLYLISFLVGLLYLTEKRVRDKLAVAFVILYALCNSTSFIVIKAASVSALIIVQKRFRGYSNLTDTIAGVVLFMTIVDPLLLYNYGFAMSTATSILMAILSPTLTEKSEGLFKKLHIRGRMTKRMLVIWFILTIGTLPFLAFYFNAVSLYTIVFMFLITPCIAVILLLSPILLVMLALLGKAPLVDSIVGLMLYITKNIPYIVERLPGSYIMLKSPSILTIFSYYLLMWILFRIVNSERKTALTRLLCAVLGGFIICGVAGYNFNALNLYFVNVGQGDGAVLHTARGETVLIDGGGSINPEKKHNIGEQVYLPYLISHGFTKIDIAVVSHYHADHVQGIIAAAENLKINTLVMPDIAEKNDYRTELEQLAKKKGIRIEYLKEGDEIKFRSGMKFDVLAPDEQFLKSDDMNDTSLVMHLTYGEFDALFTGDSPDKISPEYPKNAELLKVSHHGSKTASDAEYVSWVNPEFAVISVGKNNQYGLPNSDVLKRYKNSGAEILRTDELGDIRFSVTKDNKIRYDSYLGVE